MNTKKILLTLLLVVTLSACSSVKDRFSNLVSSDNDTKTDISQLVELEQSLNIKKVWSTRIGDGADGYYLKLSPVAGDDVIFAADHDGVVVSLAIESGKQNWKTKTKKPITGGPGLGEGLVLVGTRDGEVLALSEEDGEVLWTSQVSSEVLSAPKADLGVVVVRTVDGKAFGLDVSNGQRLWVYERAVPLLTLRGTSAPQLADGLAIIGFDGGILTALDITNGSLVWENRIALPTGRTTLERMIDIDGEPLIMGNTVYVSTFQGRVSIVELTTGKIGWVRDLSSYAGLGVDVEHVYLTDEKSEIWALDNYSGNSVWKQDHLKSRSLTAPASFGDYVVVGDYEGYLHWLNREDGSLVGRIRLDKSQILTTPFVIGDTLYSYSSKGTLAAYTIQ